MSTPLTQYIFRVIRRTNLPVQLIIYISRVLPVYVSHIRGHHHLKISGAILVTIWKGRVQEAVSYYLGDVIIVSQTSREFLIPPLGIVTAQSVKDQI